MRNSAAAAAAALERCAWERAPSVGQAIHARAVIFGWGFLATKVAFMYSKCGCVSSAERVFEEMPRPNVFAWNALLGVYASSRERQEKTLELFRGFRAAGVTPDACTLATVAKACAAAGDVVRGAETHGLAVKLGHGVSPFVVNAFVSMYGRCGRLEQAKRVFELIPEKDDEVSWNAVIAACVQHKRWPEAVEYFKQMMEAGLGLGSYTAVGVLQACGALSLLELGLGLHGALAKSGHGREIFVANALIDMYWRCSCLESAERVFDSTPEKDLVTWTGMVAGYLHGRRGLDALDAFRAAAAAGAGVDSVLMAAAVRAASSCGFPRSVKEVHAFAVRRGLLDLVLENVLVDAYGACGDTAVYAGRVFWGTAAKDVVSWTSVLNACGNVGEAVRLLYLFARSGVRPDPAAVVSALGVAGRLPSLRMVREVHGQAARVGVAAVSTVVNALADAYARCGDLAPCRKLFERAEGKELVLWTTVIGAHGMHGRGVESVGLFSEMREAGVDPDHICFLAVLHACSHSGLVDLGVGFLEMMERDYGMEPWPEHYACAVDMLSRAGKVEEAYELLTRRRRATRGEDYL